MYDVIITGAGVAGCYMAYNLSKYNINVLLLDKENDVGNETTMANSAIVHAGYDAVPGTNKAKFNAKGNLMYEKICEDLDVEFKRCGSLVLAFDDADCKQIRKIYDYGIENKVPDMKIIERDEILKMEPNINPEVREALYAPTGGIVYPFTLCAALAEVAVDNGVELKLEHEVKNIEKTDKGFKVKTDKGDFECKYFINAAGVFADRINNMVSENKMEIIPRKGNYYLLDKEAEGLVNHVIFQCPTEKGKGVLIAPTVHGNILVGPDAHDGTDKDKDDHSTTAESLDFVRETAAKSVVNIPFNTSIRTFAGLRAHSKKDDFIIGEAEDVKGFINLAGFESPGLSSIPAVAEYLEKVLLDIIKRDEKRELEVKKDFNPVRRKQIRFASLSTEEKAELIKKNSLYGRIICRCEEVPEAEILDVIHRSAGAKTVKAVKKRCRPGMGRCQGGFCSPKVQEILARELNKNMEDIPYDSAKSYILTGKTKALGGDNR